MSKKEFLIWLAGFIDGEGSLGISRRGDCGGFKPFLCVINTDRAILGKILRMFPHGYIQERSRSKSLGSRRCYALNYGKKGGLEILPAVYPYLQVKKQQADLILNFPTARYIHLEGGGRKVDEETRKLQEKIYLESRKLNSGLNSQLDFKV